MSIMFILPTSWEKNYGGHFPGSFIIAEENHVIFSSSLMVNAKLINVLCSQKGVRRALCLQVAPFVQTESSSAPLISVPREK